MLWFSNDEKQFAQVKKMNRKKIGCCVKSSKMLRRKFANSVLVLQVVSSKGDLMPPILFLQGVRIKELDYFCRKLDAVYFSTKLDFITYIPYNPIMNDKNFHDKLMINLFHLNSPNI